MAQATKGDAVRAIAQEGGPEAAALLTDLMEQSTQEMLSIERSLRASAERERDEWMERAEEAEAALRRARGRLLSIFD